MKITPKSSLHSLLSIGLILIATGAFSQQVEIKDAELRQEIDAATGDVLDNLFAAFEVLDADRITAMYADGEKALHISNMNIVQVDTIVAYTRASFREMEYIKVKWTPIDLKVFSPEIALRVIRLSFYAKGKNKPEVISNGVQTIIFKKLGAEWKIVHDQRIMK